jgi:periplasmic divalent cation tolerance protein
MASEYCLVLCTCPNDSVARQLAETVVSRHLAACVNIVPGITSVYSWKGRVESVQEQLLLIKTDFSRYPGLESCIKENHPYELPEIIAVPLQKGLPEYLGWIRQWLDQEQ